MQRWPSFCYPVPDRRVSHLSEKINSAFRSGGETTKYYELQFSGDKNFNSELEKFLYKNQGKQLVLVVGDVAVYDMG